MPSVPRYERLIQLLREKLRNGDFKVGERFFSQNELIKHYKLSFSTVTRALNELERAGYLSREQGRGTFVRSLPDKEGRTELTNAQVAVFIPWDARNPAHMNFQRLYRGLENGRPESITLRMVPYGADLSELEPFLFSRQPTHAAIFVYPGQAHVSFVDKLSETIPLVVIGKAMESPQISTVLCDNTVGAETAVRYLIEQGHRNIGMLSCALELTDSHERLDGYRRALRAAQIDYRESLVASTDPVEMNGYGATLDLFDRNSDIEITAIFAAGDIQAMGALAAARSMGKVVPRDLSVMGFDDIEGAGKLNPPLSTLHVPMEELALTAMAQVTALLKNEPRTHIVLDGRLVQRESVAPFESVYAANVHDA